MKGGRRRAREEKGRREDKGREEEKKGEEKEKEDITLPYLGPGGRGGTVRYCIETEQGPDQETKKERRGHETTREGPEPCWVRFVFESCHLGPVLGRGIQEWLLAVKRNTLPYLGPGRGRYGKVLYGVCMMTGWIGQKVSCGFS